MGRVINRWTVSVGAAESPTPTGSFSITDKLTEGLEPRLRLLRAVRSAPPSPTRPRVDEAGTRMAIHGTSEPLGEANSAGCVRSGEEDLWLLIDRAPRSGRRS